MATSPLRSTRPDRGQIAIELRGRSSQRFPKKSYGLETRTRGGGNRNVSLLGLPRENDWILYAPYNDKTLMRNALAYETARRLGRYASRTRYVELVLNGRYEGVYVLMETPKLDDERVRVADRGLSGGYLLEFTFADQVRGGRSSFRLPTTRRAVVFQDPDAEDLSRRERAWITRHLRRAERALYGRRFRSPTRGWRAYLDEAALVDFVLLNELFKNQDAFRASTFLSKGAGAKLQLGPIWDFDIAMGNSNYGESRALGGWLRGQAHATARAPARSPR